MGFNIWMLLLAGYNISSGVSLVIKDPGGWWGWVILLVAGMLLAILNTRALYKRRQTEEKAALRYAVHKTFDDVEAILTEEQFRAFLRQAMKLNAERGQ